jgi:hypothetical protein
MIVHSLSLIFVVEPIDADGGSSPRHCTGNGSSLFDKIKKTAMAPCPFHNAEKQFRKQGSPAVFCF